MESHTKEIGISYPVAYAVTVWGFRNLDNAHESGYDYEGRVKVNGKRYRAFTSSRLITYRGKLVSMAILYLCGGNNAR
jgi:hypothetical protein